MLVKWSMFRPCGHMLQSIWMNVLDWLSNWTLVTANDHENGELFLIHVLHIIIIMHLFLSMHLNPRCA